ncbi:hypothetical protein O6H91_22G031800 [Diphasiastrum complanatum]|uniref:Uncharacterized protein n=1 Tax=Diphasiastrum complanatum TaxID=34168 RepID=A0ACC2AE66_DIPCM|nr:hypothetical protein O6H91_22G031800 [Diphasiastrum complanatum]
METRRGARMVIDPKVRQVGFVTPGSELGRPAAPEPPGAAAPVPVVANSPSPVIIPLLLIPDTSSLRTTPLPVPSPPSRRVVAAPPADDSMPLGSYNPSDAILGSSQGSSERTGNNDKHGSAPTDSLADMSLSNASTLAIRLEGLNVTNDGISNVLSTSTVRSAVAAAPTSVEHAFQTSSGQGIIGSVPAVSVDMAAAANPQADPRPMPLKDRTSKAERRAIQEAQRAAKAAAKGVGTDIAAIADGNVANEVKSSKPSSQKKGLSEKKPAVFSDKKPVVSSDKKPVVSSDKKSAEKASEKDKRKDIPAPRMQFDDEQRVAKAKRRSLIEQTEAKNRVELFRHLPQFLHGTQLPSLESKFFHEDPLHPHPSVFQVGLQYLTREIVGGNARCIAMLMAFRDMINDYSTPMEKTLVRDLTAKINSHVSFLITCRPISISMGNAIKFLKTRIASLPVTVSEFEAKHSLILEIDRFIQEKIVFADNEIVKHAVTKIRDGDVLLTHGSSCVVEMILVRAFELGKKFQVVVIDSRPRLEGKGLLRRLLGKGLHCTYTHINAASYAMQGVTRVFLGAASVLSNGTVYSRVGTACVAMVAHALGVPVMICCETYKFHERVQLDSICSNELGDPDALVEVHGRKDVYSLRGWADSKHLHVLNLMYDATPADYVSMIITELGMVPPTSVPVILREYRKVPYVM